MPSLRGSETTEAISECMENKEIAALPVVVRNDKIRIVKQCLVKGLSKVLIMPEDTGSYNQVLMEHLKHPRNMGEIESPDGVGEAQNPACGDMMRLFIKVETDRIVDAKFLTFGCGAAIASSSVTTEMIKGRTIEEALMISDAVIAEAMGGLPPTKVHCSVLAEKAIRAAVLDYRRKREKREDSEDDR